MTARLVPAEITAVDRRELAKRQHVPYRIIDNCPQCLKETVVDLTEEDSLYSAKIGQPAKVYFSCHRIDCAHDWTVLVRVTITLEVIQ